TEVMADHALLNVELERGLLHVDATMPSAIEVQRIYMEGGTAVAERRRIGMVRASHEQIQLELVEREVLAQAAHTIASVPEHDHCLALALLGLDRVRRRDRCRRQRRCR